MADAVNLVVPLKRLAAAKSRLAETLSADERSSLTLAMAMDTVAAAIAAPGVLRVLVVASDPQEVASLKELGADVVADGGAEDINDALRYGAELVRDASEAQIVGALQADLPALRPAQLGAAIGAARARAFCADRHGTGTALLLSAPGMPLEPCFGPGSARAHAASGAVSIELPVPTLRADVDTPQDLAYARRLGLGPHTDAALRAIRRAS